jgi:hypothetical protein
MSATTPIFTKSKDQNFVRSNCQARTRQIGSISPFSIVCARIPLWGYGPFVNSSLNNPGLISVGGGMFNYSRMLGTSSPNPWYLASVWPYVYNQCTEQWTESYGGSKTVTTQFTQYVDQAQPQVPTNTTSGTFFGAGTVDTITITNTTFTVTYHGTAYLGPTLGSVNFTGTYVATLSGTMLQPGGSGPFNPTDPTYGWAALTAQANTLLGSSSIPAIGANAGIWTTIDPISTSPGYQISTNYFNSCTLWEYVGVAANGFPTGNSFDQTQHMPPSILDWPTPSPNTQPAGPGQPGQNHGACLSMKSTWNLNGLGWGNNAVCGGIATNLPPGGLAQVMNDHANIFAQKIDLTNFNNPGTVLPASTFANPIPWPLTVTFGPGDVTAAIGSTNFGLLGFQAAAL